MCLTGTKIFVGNMRHVLTCCAWCVQALSQDKYLLTRQLERLEEESQQEVAELQA